MSGCCCDCQGGGRRRRRGGGLLKLVALSGAFLYWYANGGREFLFGEDDDEDFGIAPDGSFTTWVNMPVEWSGERFEPQPLLNEDEVVGMILAARLDEEAVDPAGYIRPRWQVQVEADRSKLGQPINVALSEVERFAAATLA